MLKNMKVRKSLLLGFGAAVAVAIVIVVTCAILLITQANGYGTLMEVNIRSHELITSTRLEANVAARDLRSLALSLIPDDPDFDAQAMEDEIYMTLEQLDADLKDLKTIFPLDPALLTEYTDVIAEWGEQVPAILNAIHGDQTMQAAKLIQDECTPRLNEMWQAGEDLESALNQAKGEAIEALHTSVWVSIILIDVFSVVVLAAVIFLVLKITKSITDPVGQVHDALIGFSEGKLDNVVNYESQNELGEMCDALRKSQENLGHVVRATSFILNAMGQGDFTVKFRNEDIWVGEMRNIHDAIAAIKANLTDALVQVNLSAEQVAAGSEQVSTGAQALAQGATEQASAVEELSATIQDISTNAQGNAKTSAEALKCADYAGEQVNESAHNMEEMIQAMDRISESSQEISKIIATIENIAFQTNILALNAAVEAARAGSAGKGFAVVADEVRNLATKSDQAAKATKELIDRSITSVQEGTKIVDRVSDSLNKTVEATERLKTDVHEIATAVETEADSIAQINEGIDQISSVVQTNSATSEESAATSEELSSQASLMKALMAKFKLYDNNDEIRAAAGKPMFDHQAPQEKVEESVQNAASVFSKY